MPAMPDDLFKLLDELGIEHQTVEHPPFYTMEAGRDWDEKIPGLRCKNLFLKDKKDQYWLVVVPTNKRVDLNRLKGAQHAGRLSFGKPELLYELLGLAPGSVTPFGLINDTEKRVNVVLDEDLSACELLNFHPLHNEASTILRSRDLLRFLDALGYAPVFTDCQRSH